MSKNYKILKKCIISQKKITKIIDLGLHSFADTFIKKNQLHLKEPSFPLQCFLCKSSGHVQVRYLTNAIKRYNLYSYSYTSSNSEYSIKHWTKFYNFFKKKFNIVNKKVLEIGSNDGFLLSLFAKQNEILGIDASKMMSKIAKKKFNVNTENRIFSQKCSAQINKEYGKFDVIISNNVLNHSNNPIEFVKSVKSLLNRDGVFIFEVPDWGYAVKKKKFDQIYHEHISYFTFKSIQFLIDKINLKILFAERINYHGESIRVVLGFNENIKYKNFFQKQILREVNKGLFKADTYIRFMKAIKLQRSELLKKIKKIKHKKKPIICVGAAAKANTWLVFNKLNNSIVNLITDASPEKINKYTPLTRIPIKNDNILENYSTVYVKILSWNISHLLKKKLKRINRKIKFI